MTPAALTLGEPAGIGPDIVLLLWEKNPTLFSAAKIKIIGHAELLQNRADFLNVHCDVKKEFDILDIPLNAKEVVPGKLNVNHATFVIQSLEKAAQGCLEKKFSAMITGPVHKGIINQAGISFRGQTDFLTQFTRVKQTVMMLMTSELKIALLTDHIPLNQISENITRERLNAVIQIIVHDFQTRFNIQNPRILICGVNPHAGENGYLGLEEKNILIPAIQALAEKNKHINLIGPISADIAFTKIMREKADVILAMHHDQGLPVIKYAGFHQAINVTLGLPFVRTSVDHGTALDIAGTRQADCSSLLQTILLTRQLAGFSHASC